MFNTVRAELGVITQSVNELGVPLPKAVLDAQTQGEMFVAQAIAATSHSTLVESALDAIEADKDPATDKVVQRALLAQALSAAGFANQARERADLRVAQALKDNADALLQAWSEGLSVHAQTLAEGAARADLPADLHETGTVTTPEAMTRLVEVTQASRLYDVAFHAVAALIRLTGGGAPDRTFVLAEPDYEVIVDVRSHVGAKPSAWDLARAGLPIALITSLSEYTERAEEYARQAAQAQADYTALVRTVASRPHRVR